MSNNEKSIAITFDLASLGSYTDEFLATLWWLAQHHPQDSFKSREPGVIAETIGREIIRRWMAAVPAPLHNMQGHHFAQVQGFPQRYPMLSPMPGDVIVFAGEQGCGNTTYCAQMINALPEGTVFTQYDWPSDGVEARIRSDLKAHAIVFVCMMEADLATFPIACRVIRVPKIRSAQ